MKLSENEKQLIFRYFLWFYKITKEELERVDRKFTQLAADEEVLSRVRKMPPEKSVDPAYASMVKDFEKYITSKRSKALQEKYDPPGKKMLKSEYLFLKNRLKAVEQTALHLLGPARLKRIKSLYQEEMIRRILESREHT